MDKSIDTDTGSDTEPETKIIPVKIASKKTKKLPKVESEIVSTTLSERVNPKNEGIKPKKKRVMTEAQLEALAIARGKAMIALKAKKSMTDQRKALKKEDNLLRKLELERDVVKHNEYKRQLLIESGIIPPPFQKGEAKTDRGYGDTSPQETKPEIEKEVVEEKAIIESKRLTKNRGRGDTSPNEDSFSNEIVDENEDSDDEMDKLEEKLKKMKLKKGLLQKANPKDLGVTGTHPRKKKKKVITPPESEDEESEPEPEPKVIKKKKQEPPVYPKDEAKMNRGYGDTSPLKPILDNETLRNISLLFPTFK